MAANTNLTRELAERLIRGGQVACPRCGKGELVPRYSYKNRHTEFKCGSCGEIYRPTRLL